MNARSTDAVKRRQVDRATRSAGNLPVLRGRLRWVTAVVLVGRALLAAPPTSHAHPADHEHNLWPFSVRYHDPATNTVTRSSVGPLIFRKPNADADGNTVSGFR